MGIRRNEADQFITAVGHELSPIEAAKLRVTAILIAAIEDLGDSLVEALQPVEPKHWDVGALLDDLRLELRESPLPVEAKAQVSKENPPQESAEKSDDVAAGDVG